MFILPGRLKLKRFHQLASFFIFSAIFFAQPPKSIMLLLISIPKIVAFSFISNPSAIISLLIGSVIPTGIKTVFSILQHRPDSLPKSCKITLIVDNVFMSIFTSMFASSAMARALEFMELTWALAGRRGLSSATGSQVPIICKSNCSLNKRI